MRLFTDYAVLLAEMQRALAHADFDGARQARCRLLSLYGDDALSDEYRYLTCLGERFWEQELDEILARWDRTARMTDPAAPHFASVGRAFFARLIELFTPEEVLARRPTWIAPVYEALRAGARVAEGRKLLRDALLAGRAVEAGAIEDEPVDELLSENLSPPWLASLGAIRRLWPLSRLDDGSATEIAASLDEPVPTGDDRRASAFWDTLRLAESRLTVAEELIHRARVRLKRLHPQMHAEYMGLRPRDAGYD